MLRLNGAVKGPHGERGSCSLGVSFHDSLHCSVLGDQTQLTFLVPSFLFTVKSYIIPSWQGKKKQRSLNCLRSIEKQHQSSIAWLQNTWSVSYSVFWRADKRFAPAGPGSTITHWAWPALPSHSGPACHHESCLQAELPHRPFPTNLGSLREEVPNSTMGEQQGSAEGEHSYPDFLFYEH